MSKHREYTVEEYEQVRALALVYKELQALYGVVAYGWLRATLAAFSRLNTERGYGYDTFPDIREAAVVHDITEMAKEDWDEW